MFSPWNSLSVKNLNYKIYAYQTMRIVPGMPGFLLPTNYSEDCTWHARVFIANEL